jgi:hypothetical protein
MVCASPTSDDRTICRHAAMRDRRRHDAINTTAVRELIGGAGQISRPTFQLTAWRTGEYREAPRLAERPVSGVAHRRLGVLKPATIASLCFCSAAAVSLVSLIAAA